MKTAILAILTALTLAGCESSDRSYQLTREGVVVLTGSARMVVALPGWLWVDAPHCPPQLAMGPRGEVVITSNVVPTLWRMNPRTFAVSVHALNLDADTGKDVGFSSIVYSRQQASFIAYSDLQRSVWKIDPQLKAAAKVAQADAGRALPCGQQAWQAIDFIGG